MILIINLIVTKYYQRFEIKNREGISKLFKKIKEIIQINPKINLNSLTKDNYKAQFEILRKSSRVFQAYNNIEQMISNTIFFIVYHFHSDSPSFLGIVS